MPVELNTRGVSVSTALQNLSEGARETHLLGLVQGGGGPRRDSACSGRRRLH